MKELIITGVIAAFVFVIIIYVTRVTQIKICAPFEIAVGVCKPPAAAQTPAGLTTP